MIPDPVRSKLGNWGLANDRPRSVEMQMVYMNYVFFLVEGTWWTADESGILKNVRDYELKHTLNRAAFGEDYEDA